jgi:hypothetical protein
MFTDVIGFAAMSEKSGEEAVFERFDEYPPNGVCLFE